MPRVYGKRPGITELAVVVELWKAVECVEPFDRPARKSSETEFCVPQDQSRLSPRAEFCRTWHGP